MSMCGLTKDNVEYVAKSINEVLVAVPKKNWVAFLFKFNRIYFNLVVMIILI